MLINYMLGFETNFYNLSICQKNSDLAKYDVRFCENDAKKACRKT